MDEIIGRIKVKHGLVYAKDIEPFIDNLVEEVENYKDELERRNRRLHATEEAVTNIRIMLNLEHEPEVSALEAIQRMKIDLKTAVESYKAQVLEVEALRKTAAEKHEPSRDSLLLDIALWMLSDGDGRTYAERIRSLR
jgi:FMN phosphatase YigB (HAD superfamily)